MNGIIVLCRLSSSRLPGKILRPLKGKTLLEYIVERLKSVEIKGDVVICTSSDPSDDPIESFCKEHDLTCFRGDLDNVAKRFMNCIEHFGFTYAVRVNGDNLFLDANLISQMLKTAEKEKLSFYSNVKERTFPKGMSVEIIEANFFRESYPNFSAEDREHVMTYFYKQQHPRIRYYFNPEPLSKEIDLAIDTEEDLIRAEDILDKMDNSHTTYGYREILKLIESIENEK